MDYVMMTHMVTWLSSALLVIVFGVKTDATKCLKDKALGEYPVNVYYCEDSSRPLCCEENHEFTCCENQSIKTTKEQIQIWGALLAVSLIIAVVWMCYSKDHSMCECIDMKRACNKMCSCRKRTGKNAVRDKRRSFNAKYSPNANLKDPDAIFTPRWQPPSIAINDARVGCYDNMDADSGRGSVISTEPPPNSFAPTRTV